jgi:hypothetical protein
VGAASGALDGQGNYHLPAAIPPTAPLVSFVLQAVVTIPALPKGVSSSNAVTLDIQP